MCSVSSSIVLILSLLLLDKAQAPAAVILILLIAIIICLHAAASIGMDVSLHVRGLDPLEERLDTTLIVNPKALSQYLFPLRRRLFDSLHYFLEGCPHGAASRADLL